MDGWDAKIASRGSFSSEQAIKATQLLNSDKYKRWIPFLHIEKTYLFEIIYPQNRIVCDYGDEEKLVLLAIINRDGSEQSIDGHCWPDKAKKYDGINSLSELKSLQNDVDEGFVIRFKNGMRVKSKFSEYLRLHKIITQISSKSIWEYLKESKSFDELLERVPDEFYNWVKNVKERLWFEYEDIENQAKEAFRNFFDFYTSIDRKTFANYVKSHPTIIHSILFKMYDRKDYEQIIWSIIKPKHELPFKEII